MSELPIWVDLMIAVTVYWWAILPALAGVAYFVFMRLFTMPLLTRNPHELVIIFGPVRATVLKVVSKRLPYFSYHRGLYWFAATHKLGHNLIHIYFEGINQPITSLERNNDKEANLIGHRELLKQLAQHNIVIPPSLKSFARSWVLIIERDSEGAIKNLKLMTTAEAKLKVKPHYKLGLLRRIALYETTEVIAESTNASAALQTVTVQMAEQKIGAVAKGTNFSSSYMHKLLKKVIRVENNWIPMLTGAFDLRIILLIVGIIGALVVFYMMYQPPDISSLGPPPPGINLGR